MNCCDDTGQCRQGHGCPVRCTTNIGELPEPTKTDDGNAPYDWLDTLQTSFLQCCICFSVGMLAGMLLFMVLIARPWESLF